MINVRLTRKQPIVQWYMLHFRKFSLKCNLWANKLEIIQKKSSLKLR